MKAYIDLDSGYDLGSTPVIPGVAEDDVVAVGRSKYDTPRKHEVGDILAFLNGSTDPCSAYVSKPLGCPLPQYCKPDQILCAGLLKSEAEELVHCIQKLSMRASVARAIDLRGVIDCSVVVAPSLFWERLFLVHVRWSRNRMVEFDAKYHSMIINFCASLYEYEVAELPGLNEQGET